MIVVGPRSHSRSERLWRSATDELSARSPVPVMVGSDEAAFCLGAVPAVLPVNYPSSEAIYAIGIRPVGPLQVQAGEELQVAANIGGGRQVARTDATPRDVVGDNADKMMPLTRGPWDRPARLHPSGPLGVVFDAELMSHAPHQDAPTLPVDQVDFIDLEADVGAVDREQLCPATASKDDRLVVHRVVHGKNKGVMTDDHRQAAHWQGFHQPPAFSGVDVI
jgi:hypothetical protein